MPKKKKPAVEPEKLYASLLPGRKAEAAEAAAALAEGEAPPKGAKRLAQAIDKMDAGDVADLLETLPPEHRQEVAAAAPRPLFAEVLGDMSEAAARTTLEGMGGEELAKLLGACDDEQAAALLRLLGPKRRSEMITAAGLGSNAKLLRLLAFAPDTVGEIMDHYHVAAAADETLAALAARLKGMGDLPNHCDKLFITADGRLAGVLPLKRIILADGGRPVSEVMVAERVHRLRPEMSIEEAAALFERYDLISAPVVREDDAVIGRVTIDEIMFHLRHDQHEELLAATGMRDEEDLYAPMAQRLRNRGFWIFINLIAAFLVSRVVGAHEHAIAEIVALASLMPIIASMAGNTGMQTATLTIRALTLRQITGANWPRLLLSELGLSLLNGAFWGVVVGLFSLVFYRDLGLAAVLTVSMALVFFFAAASGFLIPLLLEKLKGDPALGTAVIVTTLTDCLGFLIFLGLAARFLVA
ncbi:MAG: magnesium transporter [Betaproteobacteria bacterium AqS2]|uniref:Magnesium transporter n=1 Tax=Candidatus Amphirhobacter heronislandensis TaxID=1732024 RepID=A0A930Y0S2_9GAMM|nr:magnesium transporter [Betaproteobacteria bacterium AqS2]